MADRGLLTTPPADVLAEVAAATAGPAEPAAGPGVRDLRDLAWTSIDNVESQDLDQIELCEDTADGFTLYVGIADVDHLVPAAGKTDRFAAHNTTSVYTGVRTFPMLPDRLSYDRTSLLGEQVRLALVIETKINRDGSPGPGQVYRALVRNQAKLDYPSISDWLSGKSPPPPALAARSPLLSQVRMQDDLARLLAEARTRAGALNLDTGEVREVLDNEGRVLDLSPHHPGRASRLIEELMIASNCTVARALDAAGFASLRRVVKKPERWAGIVSYAATHGFTLSEAPSSLELSRFVSAMRGARTPEEFAEISLSLVKLMGRGEYAAHAPGQSDIGHFGLATDHYTHATAPNRRYPDLITQRLLLALLAKRPAPYSLSELSALAEHCSAREADAQKIERRVLKSVAAQLLVHRVGQVFDGLITGASPKGTWVRVRSPSAEGRVVAGEAGLRVGEKVRVRLHGISVERGFIDFTVEGGQTR